MQLKNKINHNVTDYFRRSLQVSSTNLSDSNMPFPYKHEFFTGLNNIPFLSFEAELINFPINQGNIQKCYSASYEQLNDLKAHYFPRYSIGFQVDLEVEEDLIENLFKKKDKHITPEDLQLIDSDIMKIYDEIVFEEIDMPENSKTTPSDTHESNDKVGLSHPTKAGVFLVSALEVVPFDIDHSSTFQVMLDSSEEDINTILELHDGWKHPTTKFSHYNKTSENIYKYNRDYASNIPKDTTKSYIISIPKNFIHGKKDQETNKSELSVARIFPTKSPKILLSKISSMKKRQNIKIS
ncbi:hypothetical protein HWI79_738 [Cryptosporidium felis]|nr:hypothetical protein HWI79_738 [Cryptosporidium felis]